VSVAFGEGVCGATVSSAVAEGNSGASVGSGSAEALRLPKASPTTKSVRKMMSYAPALAASAIRQPIRVLSELAVAPTRDCAMGCASKFVSCAPQEGQYAPAGPPCQPQVAQDTGAASISQPSSITAPLLRKYE
jgi:hypothetical protein